MEKQVKVFNIVALASVCGLALASLGNTLFALFGMSCDWKWNYIDIAAFGGLCAAFVLLLVSKIRNSFALCGGIGCCLVMLTQLFVSMEIFIPKCGLGWINIVGSILVAISILRFPRSIHPAARVLGLVGTGYIVLLGIGNLILYGLLTMRKMELLGQFMGVLGWAWAWPEAIARVLFVIPFVALARSRWAGSVVAKDEPHKYTLIGAFAYSVFVIGVVVCIFGLVCASPLADSNTWSREKMWNSELVGGAIYTLIVNALLGFFILSQIKVRDCLAVLKVEVVEPIPMCIRIIQVALYIMLVACVGCIIWGLFADDNDFQCALGGVFIKSMSIGMFNELSRISAVINLRVYFILGMLVTAWYSFGLAKFMSLMGVNSATACSLSHTQEGGIADGNSFA